MRVRSRFLVGACVIATAIGYLIVTAIRNTAEYYLTVDEVGTRRAELEGQAIRIAGRVRPGSVSWDPRTLTLAFAIAAIPNSAGAGVEPAAAVAPLALRVVCVGQPKPDMFAEGRDVIVEGRLGPGGEVAASQVLTSCPSKYTPKDPKTAPG
jgi:cytochrome c-type biogenesis protein CcmE